LPTPFGILCDATGLDSLLGKSRLARFDHAAARTVDQIIGACMLIRRDDFEILGGFDERFFIYYEEVDLCKRVVDAGGEVWFRPEARVTHLGGASCESPSAVDRMPGYLRRSRSQYFAKHFGLAPQFLVLGITLLECACKAMVLSIPSGNETADAAVVRFSRRNGFVAVLTEWRRRGNAGKESDS
ncbi:MAG: hypothetical protein LBE84_06450, partial [Planctomycetota bacterium]|nr:hypothetical protein [Planctomycetota bacterium]